jgi:hypothetical protein
LSFAQRLSSSGGYNVLEMLGENILGPQASFIVSASPTPLLTQEQGEVQAIAARLAGLCTCGHA